jgi:sulfite reductase (NADPH) flavoprotein alpha-component
MSAVAAAITPYSRSNPFPGRMIVNRRLSAPDSPKDTRHFEVDLTGSRMKFEVGDSMAFSASNDPALVDEILGALGATGDEPVPRNKGETISFREALLRKYSITYVTPKFLKAIVKRASSAPFLRELLEPDRKHDLESYLWGMELIDFLIEHPSVGFKPEELVELLSKLQPRLYSVASSLKMYPDSVHFIVDVIRYESHGRQRKGVASSFLAERAENVPVPVFPTTAKHFHLPEDPKAALIMVGPGTGIAPFRAFLQDRKATGARGKSWLFFGAQREKSDYYYQDEFAAFQKEGYLTRIDTAFSRDQADKIYVQHRMRENAAEIWRWLEAGAYFFVCGDARRMAKDVDAILRKIVQEQSGKSAESANEYVEKLKNEKRYKRDVY